MIVNRQTNILLILFLLGLATARSQATQENQEIFSKSTLKLLSKEADKFFTSQKDTTKRNTGWTKNGIITAVLNQSSFSNWSQGGENAFALNVNGTYNINYIRGRNTWNIRFMGAYGFTKTNSRFFKKTTDWFEVNAIRGYRIARNFYYSAFGNLKGQFDYGYTYYKNEVGVEMRTANADPLLPLFFKVGAGFLWRKNDNLRINFSPFALNETIVNSKYTTPNNGYYGVKQGNSTRTEVGANLEVYYFQTVFTNISFQNILVLYSEYSKFKSTDLDYRLQIVMKINKVFSTDIMFQTLYDNDVYDGFQVRQIWGLGLNYTL